jgi:Fe-S cluster assembly protein SufB
LTSLRLERLATAGPAQSQSAETTLSPLRRSAGRAAFRDFALPSISLSPELSARGLVVSDLSAAVRERPDLVHAYLGAIVDPESTKYAALAAALWRSGLFVFVPAGLRVELPLQVQLTLASPATALFWRTLVVAEPGSHLTIVEESRSTAQAGGSLSAGTVELVVGEGASIDHVAIERWAHGVSSAATRLATVAREGRIRWFGGYLGSEQSRVNTGAFLTGERACTESIGVYFASEQQQINLSSRVVHSAAGTASTLDWSGAVGDSAHAALTADVAVEPAASEAEIRLSATALSLGSLARVDLDPHLRVERHDARVFQSASVRRLDEQRSKALTAAGFSRAHSALAQVCEALAPAVSRLPNGRIRRAVEQTIAAKVLG